jgi:hypothetical protein
MQDADPLWRRDRVSDERRSFGSLMRSTFQLIVFAALALGLGIGGRHVDATWAKVLLWLGAVVFALLALRTTIDILSRLFAGVARAVKAIRAFGPEALASGGLSLLRPDHGRRVSAKTAPENPRSIRAVVSSGGLSLLREPEKADSTGVPSL